jgi:hypothetical protein
MNTTLNFERVILTKELNDKLKKVGDVFEIASILNDSSFLLRDARTKVAIGVVSFDDFEEHFVHEENFKGWTQWTPITGFDGQTDAFYRTNHRKVQMKFLADKVRAEACCDRGDEFNLSFGVQLAYLRCLNKALNKRKSAYEDALKDINREIADIDVAMKKMVNSLD